MTVMTGKEALIELFRKEGVEYIFGIPGATEVAFMDVLGSCPEIKYILGLNEVVCAGMAEGYARASGKVGVLNLHTLAGLAASMSMLTNAYAGGVPLLITAGQQDTRLLMREPPLSGDLVRMASQLTKWSTEVSYAADIPVAIQRAFKVATQPPTGPVFVSLPQDVLNQSLDFEYTPTAPSFPRLRPDKDAINRAAELLATARNPAIIVESGIAKNSALPDIVKLAELTGARVFQQWMSDVNFPVNHPQYMGDMDPGSPQSREFLKSVDVLVAVGCPLFFEAFYQPKPALTAKTNVIQIDDNPWEISKNFPVAVGVQGNIQVSLAELVEILKQRMSALAHEAAKTRVKDIARQRDEMNAVFLKKAEQEKDNVPISISRLMQELKNVITPDTIIVDDCWSSSGTLRRTLDLTEPKSFQRARGGGSIGWGLPGALGVKLGAPDRPVVGVSGDGSALWSIQSLWTAARYQIPVTYVITANATYLQVKIMRKIVLGKGEITEKCAGMELDEPQVDFCQLAQSMGVQGLKVEYPKQLREILKSAIDSNRPSLVEVYV